MTAEPNLQRELELQARGSSTSATTADQPDGDILSEAPLPDAQVVEQKATKPAMQLIKWIGSFAVPGIGMFMEAYFIFSVGNIKPIWAEQYPACWKVNFHYSSRKAISNLFIHASYYQFINCSPS